MEKEGGEGGKRRRKKGKRREVTSVLFSLGTTTGFKGKNTHQKWLELDPHDHSTVRGFELIVSAKIFFSLCNQFYFLYIDNQNFIAT